MRELKDKLMGIQSMIGDAVKMCSGLYPEGEDSEDEMNGGPKTAEGKPMEAGGDDYSGKESKKAMIAAKLAKKVSY